jgi:hypothetical protein
MSAEGTSAGCCGKGSLNPTIKGREVPARLVEAEIARSLCAHQGPSKLGPYGETARNSASLIRRESWSGGLRWAGGLVAALLLPKCVACVATYLTVVTGVMRAAPELCGATESVDHGRAITGAMGVALGLAVWSIRRARRGVSVARRLVR